MESQSPPAPPAHQPRPAAVRVETQTDWRDPVAIATVRVIVELVEREPEEPGYGHGV